MTKSLHARAIEAARALRDGERRAVRVTYGKDTVLVGTLDVADGNAEDVINSVTVENDRAGMIQAFDYREGKLLFEAPVDPDTDPDAEAYGRFERQVIAHLAGLPDEAADEPGEPQEYRVQITATACAWREETVLARSPEEAERIALKRAKDDRAYPDSATGWELNGLVHGEDGFGDLEVTECELSEEED